jgi:hypothetical protein
MELLFNWRRPSASDLAEGLKLHPAKMGAEVVGECRASQAWQRMFEMKHACRGAVIEARWEDKVEIVGFGFGAFVKKSFTDAEREHPAPGLNSRIVESVACGSSVIATPEEVRDANTSGDLHQVIMDTSWKQNRLSAAQVDDVRILLGRAYYELFSGYRFSLILLECVDGVDLWHIEGHLRMRIADRFEAWRKAHPGSAWNEDRALVEVTSDTMRKDPHSIAAEIFHHGPPPQIGFTLGEQELLEVALQGVDDAEASKALFVTVPAIKRRWAGIFARASDARPDVCPPDAGSTRGVQKRQRVLAYVRQHPQELRPFNFGGGQKKRK